MANFGRASALLAAGTMASRVLGFAKVALLAYAIGQITVGANSFAVANQLPNNVYAIVAGGVLQAVLVPQIVRSALHADGGRAYLNKLLTVSIVVLTGATLIATLLAPVLIAISTSGWSPEQRALGTAFAYWCLPQIFFYGLYTMLGEVLNGRNSFGPFTWAPLLNNVIAIAGLGLYLGLFGAGERPLGDWGPGAITVLGGSATLGVAAQALILFVAWRRIGLSYRPDFHWRGVGLRRAGTAGGWTFAMILTTQVAGLISTNVASLAPAGTPSNAVLANSWLIFMLPHSIVTVSIATVYFTRMAEHGTAGRIRELTADLLGSIRTIVLVMALATGVLIVTAYPFGRVFTNTAAQAHAMGDVIIAYGLGLITFSLVFLLQRAFYALDDTRTPFLFTLFQSAVFVVCALLATLLPGPAIAVGIAVSMSVSSLAQAAMAAVLLRRRLGSLDGRGLIRSGIRYLIAGVPALIVGLGVALLLGVGGWWIGGPGGFAVAGRGQAIVSMVLISAVMGVVYLAVLRAIRAPELAEAIGPIAGRFARSRRRPADSE